jgi:hypothetical protein
MTFTKRLEFANYTCNFGENLTLLDLFEEVVWPSFRENSYTRKIGMTEYFFLNTQIMKFGDSSGQDLICAVGRLVKNTRLKRDQIFRKDKGIVDDYSELETAPSSLFALILNNHRLIFTREVAGAPDIDAFRSTSEKFLKNAHKKFIEDLFETKASKVQDDKTAIKIRRSLLQEFPAPRLRITPLTDRQELQDFINKFESVKQLVVKLLPTNQEDIDNDGFWTALDSTSERIDSIRTTLSFANTRDKLDGQEVYAQCNSASALGNSEINVKGFDRFGDKLEGNNDDFRLSVEVGELSKDVTQAAPVMVDKFVELADSGAIQKPTTARNAIAKIQNIIGRFLR